MGCPKTFAQYCNATLDMICHIAAKHINTDIVTKLLFYEHQIQNNIQWNYQEANVLVLCPSFMS